MLVFWWHGRGYQTIWIWLLTLCGFGILANVGKPFVPDRPWYWGLGFCVAAGINWFKGTALNAQSLERSQPKTLWQRLFYKARHRFMSLPMETFSIVLVLVGIGIAIQGTLKSAN